MQSQEATPWEVRTVQVFVEILTSWEVSLEWVRGQAFLVGVVGAQAKISTSDDSALCAAFWNVPSCSSASILSVHVALVEGG